MLLLFINVPAVAIWILYSVVIRVVIFAQILHEAIDKVLRILEHDKPPPTLWWAVPGQMTAAPVCS